MRDEYDGDAGRIWTGVDTGAELFARVTALPGFGEQKARIFVALLAKQLGVRPEGWERAAGHYAEQGSCRSVADVVDAESLQKVRDFKKAAKAEAKAAKATGWRTIRGVEHVSHTPWAWAAVTGGVLLLLAGSVPVIAPMPPAAKSAQSREP